MSEVRINGKLYVGIIILCSVIRAKSHNLRPRHFLLPVVGGGGRFTRSHIRMKRGGLPMKKAVFECFWIC